MFEDSLLEYKTKKRSPWATIFSFVVQVGLVGVMILVPLIYTEALPKQQLMTFLVAPPPPPPPPPPPVAQQIVRVQKVISELDNGELRTPTKIPKKILIAKDEEQPVSGAGGVIGGIGGVPGGQMGGVIGGIIASTPVAIPKAATPTRVRVSAGVTEGLLIHKVQPTYPPLARSARIQGQVILQAVIGKDGAIQNLRAVSGHPMLTPAAIEAVKQWRYKPYFLNGEPVEVDTQITVNFTLAGG